MESESSRRSGAFRPGFTLIEMVVVIAAIAVLAGVVLTQVVGVIGRSQAAALGQNLSAIAKALDTYRGDIGRYPPDVSHLTAMPTGTTLDTCGRPTAVNWSTRWQGPYLQTHVGPAGIPAGDATIAVDLVREPPTLAGGLVADLRIDVSDVDRGIALELDAAFDGGDGLSSGGIRWSVTSGERGYMSYRIPIRGC